MYFGGVRMGRKSIFEILESTYDFEKELNRIDDLLSYTDLINHPYYKSCSFEKYFDDHLIHLLEYSCRYVSCSDIKEALGWETIDDVETETIEDVLRYLEYAANIFELCKKDIESKPLYYMDRKVSTLNKNIYSLLNHLNYETRFLDDRYIVVEKNPIATTVAEILDNENSMKIIEYNHYLLKGDLQRKKEILFALGNEFEPLRDKLEKNGYKMIVSDAGHLLNNMNIRHNNCEGEHYQEHTANLSSEELEKWYDKTYDVLLFAFMADNYINLHEEIKELRKHY